MFAIYDIQRRRFRINLEQPLKIRETSASIKITYNAFADMKDMLHHAYNNGYAVGAFDLVSLDFLEGIISAAERCRAPVILSLAECHISIILISS